MIRVVFVFLLNMLWLCTPVSGGAWLREGKAGFLAFTSTTRTPEDLSFLNSDSSAYLEYGAMRTVGKLPLIAFTRALI